MKRFAASRQTARGAIALMTASREARLAVVNGDVTAPRRQAPRERRCHAPRRRAGGRQGRANQST